MANIDKFFYQQAAQELAVGRLDQALWLKVRADNPYSDEPAAQALYVRARAAELALEHGRETLKRIGNGAVSKTRRVIQDAKEGVAETLRWAFKWSLLYIPAMVLLFAWSARSDEQYHYQTFLAQIDSLDHAAAQNNLSDYQRAMSNATTSCNELDAISKKPVNLFRDSTKEYAVQKRCARLGDIIMDFNNHLAEINQEQSQGDLHFQLKTIEKL